jgi:hypothetical protein
MIIMQHVLSSLNCHAIYYLMIIMHAVLQKLDDTNNCRNTYIIHTERDILISFILYP